MGSILGLDIPSPRRSRSNANFFRPLGLVGVSSLAHHVLSGKRVSGHVVDCVRRHRLGERL